MGDLTDRHNRYASPRFADDYLSPEPRAPVTWQAIPDGIPDDVNGDGVVDYYPTMYFNSEGGRAPQRHNHERLQ